MSLCKQLKKISFTFVIYINSLRKFIYKILKFPLIASINYKDNKYLTLKVCMICYLRYLYSHLINKDKKWHLFILECKLCSYCLKRKQNKKCYYTHLISYWF